MLVYTRPMSEHITTDEAVARVALSYAALGGGWLRIAAIAEHAGLTPAQTTEAIQELKDYEDFSATPEPMGWRVTDLDRTYAVTIGGEACHLINWGE